MTSIEGDSQTNWPSSPALQQVSIEEINGSQVAFGVGMSGKSHWSASFMILDGDSPKLICEMACRAKDQPQFLGSEYRLETKQVNAGLGVQLIAADDVILNLTANESPVQAESITPPENGHLVFKPNEKLAVGTIQWKFEIAFA